MTSSGSLNPESENFHQARPIFWIGQHDSARVDALTDDHYDQIRNAGVRLYENLRIVLPRHQQETNLILSSLGLLRRLSPMSASISGSRPCTGRT